MAEFTKERVKGLMAVFPELHSAQYKYIIFADIYDFVSESELPCILQTVPECPPCQGKKAKEGGRLIPRCCSDSSSLINLSTQLKLVLMMSLKLPKK